MKDQECLRWIRERFITSFKTGLQPSESFFFAFGQQVLMSVNICAINPNSGCYLAERKMDTVTSRCIAHEIFYLNCLDKAGLNQSKMPRETS